MEWDRGALEACGFVGWCAFRELPHYVSSIAREAGGVYVVYRAHGAQPEFLAKSPAGIWRGDPTVDLARLEAKWVEGAHVLNIGKANPRQLRNRLRAYASFGNAGRGWHFGGRYVWQLADAWDCLVAWRVTDDAEDPRTVERQMIAAFLAHYGKRPFANLTA
jgi:hypothetical protein